MKRKIKMVATIAAQYMVNSEVEGIVHEGTFYVPLLPGIEGGGKSEGSSTASTSRTESAASETKAAPAKSAPVKSAKVYTEDEMMSMDSKDLEKILSTSYPKVVIDPATKNTNKKLRLLILDAQEEGGAETEEEEEKEETAPATRGGRGSAPATKLAGKELKAKISDILLKLDDGKTMDEETAVKELAKIGGDAKVLAKIVDKFMTSPKEPISTFEGQLFDEIEGDGGAEDEDDAPTKKAPVKKAAAKKTSVTADELEVGQRVGVWWVDNDGFFDGEVAKIDRKGVLIKYDDGTEEYLDAKNNTEIELLD